MYATLIFLSSVLVLTTAQQWVQIPGMAIQVTAKGLHTCAITPLHQPICLVDGSWKPLSQKYRASVLGAAADGNHVEVDLWSNDTTDNFYIYNLAKKDWTQEKTAPDKTEGLISSTNAYNRTSIVGVGLSAFAGCSLKLNGKVWTPLVPGDCNNYHLAIGDQDETWKLDLDGNLYRLNGKAWDSVNRPPLSSPTITWVDVENSTRIVATDDAQQVHFYDGKFWYLIPSPQCHQATINKENITCIDIYHRIFRTPLGVLYAKEN